MSKLIKFEPFRELSDFRDAFDRFFGRSLLDRRFEDFGNVGFTPKIEVVDRKDALLVKAEIPGIDKKDVKVSIEDDNLIIQGEHKKETETKEEGYYYSERNYGNFYRSIPLAVKVDEKEVKAKYADGLVTITLPKSKETKEKTKVITIE